MDKGLNHQDFISSIDKNIITLEKIKNNKFLFEQANKANELILRVLKNRNKILFAGNGGSAAESQHMAAEYVGRFLINRQALAAVSLTSDTSTITALGNDLGYESIFSRQIEAIGLCGDLLITYTTSGNSANIINALKTAKKKNISSIVFTGESIKNISSISDIVISIPSSNTPIIQQCHTLLGHILCEHIEKKFTS